MMLHPSFLVDFLLEELDVFEATPRLHGLHDGAKQGCCQQMLGCERFCFFIWISSIDTKCATKPRLVIKGQFF